jgi:hypothetical protein
MEMIWASCQGLCLGGGVSGSSGPPWTLSNDCLANPVMQAVSNMPSGTSAPNTVITEYAVSKYHLQAHLFGWLIQAPVPLTATQINAARQFALAHRVTVETKSGAPYLGDFADGATALGIVIACGVLAIPVPVTWRVARMAHGGRRRSRSPPSKPARLRADPSIRPGWRRVAASGRRRRTASRCRSRDHP